MQNMLIDSKYIT